MTTVTSSKPSETSLRQQIPGPPAIRIQLLENRRERVLLRQLLKLAERVHADDAPKGGAS